MPNDIIIDAVLAGAIAAHGGSVGLLLPVLRPQCKTLLAEGETDFVARVHKLLATVAADSRYSAAFEPAPRIEVRPKTAMAAA